MRYSPENFNIKPLMITILLTVMAVFSLLFAGQMQNLKWLFQLLFLCLATAAIQIYLKYVLTKFEYVCDSENLSIYKIMGRKRLCVGSLALENSICEVIPYTDYVKNKEEYNKNLVYNYTRNFKTENVYVYIFDFNGKNITILLEISKEYAEYINIHINEKMKGELKNDEF